MIIILIVLKPSIYWISMFYTLLALIKFQYAKKKKLREIWR